jgi:hypothetical protein
MTFTYNLDRRAMLVDFYIDSAEHHVALDFEQSKQMCEDILSQIRKLEEQQ